MEGVEDEDFDFGSPVEAPDVPPVQDAEPTDPLGPDDAGDGDDSLSPPKHVTLDGSGGKTKLEGAGKLAGG